MGCASEILVAGLNNVIIEIRSSDAQVWWSKEERGYVQRQRETGLRAWKLCDIE